MHPGLRKPSTLNLPGAPLFLRHWAGIVCLIALTFMAVNMVSAIGRKSITNDEVVLILSGYFYLMEQNLRLNAEHPPLAKLWSSIPDAATRRETSAPARISGWSESMFSRSRLTKSGLK